MSRLTRRERSRIEDKLYQYPVYRDWLKSVPAEYAYRHLQANLTEPTAFGGECNDVTATAVADLHGNARYIKALRVVAEVEVVWEYLDDDERRAIKLTYFQPNNLNYIGISRRMNVSKSAYYRYRNSALDKFAIVMLGKGRENNGKQSA